TVGSQIVDVAESPKRFGARILVRHALRHEARDAALYVKLDFFVELSREPFFRGRKTKDPPDAARTAHVNWPRESVRPRSRSAATSARSCARPRGVSE